MIGEHRGTVARTLRETFGVGLSDLGDGVLWGEAKLLLDEAASDPSTALGAELAGWAYRASFPELLTLIATIGDRKASQAVMPWAVSLEPTQTATPDEIAIADAELERSFIFT